MGPRRINSHISDRLSHLAASRSLRNVLLLPLDLRLGSSWLSHHEVLPSSVPSLSTQCRKTKRICCCSSGSYVSMMTAKVYDWHVDVFGQRRSQISDCAETVPCLLLVWFKGLQIPRRATICARLLHSQGVRCHRLPSQRCAYNVAFSLCHLVLYEHEYSMIFFSEK